MKIEIYSMKTGEVVNVMTVRQWQLSCNDETYFAIESRQIDIATTVATYNQNQECASRQWRARVIDEQKKERS